MEEIREFIAEVLLEIITKCKKGDGKAGKPWCLYSKKTGKLLGRHPSKESARNQEVAIQYAKHG